MSEPGPLVALVVGDVGRSGGSRAGGRQVPQGRAGPSPTGEARTVATSGGARQWSCRWGPDGPGEVSEGPVADAALTLGLSWEDARQVASGELPPSVAYMQGRLKSSGDNALLLKLLAWTATPAFEAALAGWSGSARPPG